MTLSSAGAIANQSLGTISSQINVVSRNIAGNSVSGYAAKTALVSTNSIGGVQYDGVARATNMALFQNALQATSSQASSAVLSDGLDQIDRALGLSTSSASDPSATRTPVALISQLAGALQVYSASPSDATAAQSVLSSATALAGALGDATAAVQRLRQQADGEVATSVDHINQLLAQFRQVNADIVSGTQAGRDVSENLDKRDALLTQLSSEIGVTTMTRANNDMVIYTDSGATLFETTPRTVSFQPIATYDATATGNAVYVDGVQVTGASATMAIQSGKLQGLTQLRDVVATQFQSQLDETARGLIVAFAENDQTGAGGASSPGLFTYSGATTIPDSSLVAGLAGRIMVNANADPTRGGNLDLLRDGGISNPYDSAYSYNPTGAAGYAGRIDELVAALSSSQAFDSAAGLASDQSVTDYATASIGWLAAQRQNASETKSYYATLVSETQQALSNATGVNLDDQMSKMLELENSYQASAKLLSVVDAMYTALFQAL
jgi:flagellar hook-associated protein 1 FlgK